MGHKVSLEAYDAFRDACLASVDSSALVVVCSSESHEAQAYRAMDCWSVHEDDGRFSNLHSLAFSRRRCLRRQVARDVPVEHGEAL